MEINRNNSFAIHIKAIQIGRSHNKAKDEILSRNQFLKGLPPIDLICKKKQDRKFRSGWHYNFLESSGCSNNFGAFTGHFHLKI